MHILDPKFKHNPKPYIVQSLMAFVAVAVILYFVEVMTHAAIVAALGSSTFIVFATPGSRAARPRELIGGHVVAVVVGAVCYFGLVKGLFGQMAVEYEFVPWLVGALAVGLSIFLMTVINTEHPPAAGTALGIVAQGWVGQAVIFAVAFAICLAIVRRLLRRYLVDLY